MDLKLIIEIVTRVVMKIEELEAKKAAEQAAAQPAPQPAPQPAAPQPAPEPAPQPAQPSCACQEANNTEAKAPKKVTFKKRVITERDLIAAGRGITVVSVPERAILTDLAKDYVHNHDITVERL